MPTNASNRVGWDMLISIFDTTVTDNNLGNAIIMDAVERNLKAIFPAAFRIHLPYLDSIGRESINYIRNSDYVFFGGTNSLSSDMEKYKQWGLDRNNIQYIQGVVLMGVGWWQYQGPPSRKTALTLRRVLSSDLLHSVRDHYTARQLLAAGIRNVIVTGCPSMWSLTKEHCAEIPHDKAENVLLTFTGYNKNEQLDYEIARRLFRHYSKIYFWVQGSEDYRYAKGCGVPMEMLAPDLCELDQLLGSSDGVDYVGTRLHAGIRALQSKRRSIILGIDNRALESARDFALPVVGREDIDTLFGMIERPLKTEIGMPFDSIALWKSQFANRPGVQRGSGTKSPPRSVTARAMSVITGIRRRMRGNVTIEPSAN